MSGDTEKWTLGTLYVHVVSLVTAHRRENDDRDRLLVQIMDERRDSMRDAFERYTRDQQVALTKAEDANSHRFESLAQAQAQADQRAAEFLTRTEYDTAHRSLEGRLADLNDRMNRQTGERAGFRSTGGLIGASIAAVASLVVVISIIIELTIR